MELHNFSSRLESRAQDLDGATPEHAEEDLSETYHHALRSFTRVLRGGGVAVQELSPEELELVEVLERTASTLGEEHRSKGAETLEAETHRRAERALEALLQEASSEAASLAASRTQVVAAEQDAARAVERSEAQRQEALLRSEEV